MKRRVLSSFYLFVLFIVVSTILVPLVLNQQNPNTLLLWPQDFSSDSWDMSYRLLKPDDSIYHEYHTKIPSRSFYDFPSEDYKVLIHHFNSQGYQVYFNGAKIGSVGDMVEGRSNLWHSIHAFSIDNKLVQEENELVIKSLGLFDTGLCSHPIVMGDSLSIDKKMTTLNFLISGLNFTLIGALVFGFWLLMGHYLLFRKTSHHYMYFSLALLASSIYSLNYIPFDYLPISYLAFKKIANLGVPFSLVFILWGIESYFEISLDKRLPYGTLIGSLAFTVFCTDIIIYHQVFRFFNLLVLANIGHIMYHILRLGRQYKAAKIVAAGGLGAWAFSLYSGLMAHGKTHYALYSPLIYITLFAFVPLVLVLRDLQRTGLALMWESHRRERAYQLSITDKLTGLYNRAHFESVVGDMEPPFSLALVDIDNLKDINDSLGHGAGDLALKHVVSELKKYTRKTDLIFRYGGDEFIILLQHCDLENAYTVLDNLRKAIASYPAHIRGHRVPMTISGGVRCVQNLEDIDTILEDADRALYRSKDRGKNTISIFGM